MFVLTLGVEIAVMGGGLALVNIFTVNAVSTEPCVTFAFKSTISINTTRICVTVIHDQGTLINVGTSGTITAVASMT